MFKKIFYPTQTIPEYGKKKKGILPSAFIEIIIPLIPKPIRGGMIVENYRPA